MESKLSEDGEAFLKVTTSAPDFEDLAFAGIPDDHSGPTICLKQYVTSTVSAPAGQTTYFIMTPQPEVAYWSTSITDTQAGWINGQPIIPTLFPKAGQIFTNAATLPATNDVGGSNSSQLSAVRMVTSSAELNCLNNSFNQYGSITSFKVPLKVLSENVSPSTVAPRHLEIVVNGIDGLVSRVVGSTAYSEPVRKGVYAIAMNREDEFDFCPIRDNESLHSTHNAYYAAPAAPYPGLRAIFDGPLTVFDNNFDTIVFRIDVPAGVVDQSFLLKRWVTFEAEPVFNSLLWDTAHQSPSRDQVALTMYSEINRGLPVAVWASQNPDFWSRVLDIVDEASDVLSYLPGPIGTGAKGVHAIAEALKSSKSFRRKKKKKQKGKKKTVPRSRKGANKKRGR